MRKFGLEDVCSEVLQGLGCISFHATFRTVGESDGIGINDQALSEIQPCMFCVGCVCPEAARGRGALLWWCRAQAFSRESQQQVSLANAAFPLPMS